MQDDFTSVIVVRAHCPVERDDCVELPATWSLERWDVRRWCRPALARLVIVVAPAIVGQRPLPHCCLPHQAEAQSPRFRQIVLGS